MILVIVPLKKRQDLRSCRKRAPERGTIIPRLILLSRRRRGPFDWKQKSAHSASRPPARVAVIDLTPLSPFPFSLPLSLFVCWIDMIDMMD